MVYREYGNNNSRTVILLHGGGLSWWNYREAAELLQDSFRVILPVLDGHAGSDAPFTSIENNSAEIIGFIREHLGGRVFLAGGLSLGAQILLEMLSQQGSICEHAIIESAAVIPSALTNRLIAPAFGCSYPLVKHRWFSELQFRSLHMKKELFEDYYRDTCAIAKKDMIAFMQANTAYAAKQSLSECTAAVHLYYGGKEVRQIKRSAGLIKQLIPGCTVQELPGLFHGELSLNDAAGYADIIRSLGCHEGQPGIPVLAQ